MLPQVLHGARIACYVNGKLFGQCTGFNWTSNTVRKEIQTIDIAHPVELAATRTSVTWTMNVLRIAGDGGVQGAGMVAGQVNVIKEKYFTLLLVDLGTDLTVFKCDFNQTSSESWSIMSKGMMTGQVNGTGIVWVNEASQ